MKILSYDNTAEYLPEGSSSAKLDRCFIMASYTPGKDDDKVEEFQGYLGSGPTQTVRVSLSLGVKRY